MRNNCATRISGTRITSLYSLNKKTSVGERLTGSSGKLAVIKVDRLEAIEVFLFRLYRGDPPLSPRAFHLTQSISLLPVSAGTITHSGTRLGLPCAHMNGVLVCLNRSTRRSLLTLGAVMFGDKLDREQCERLVDRLKQTRTPFICAHGRPSLVPLCVIKHNGA
jgi:hypothetical protein